MSIYAQPGQIIEPIAQGAPTGLVGTIGIQIIDTPAGTSVLPRTTAGIQEQPVGSGVYSVSLTAPSTEGTYSIVWDQGTVTPTTVAVEELIVSADVQAPISTPTTPTVLEGARTFVQLQNEVLAHDLDAEKYRERVKKWLNEALHRVSRRVELPEREVAYAFDTVLGQTNYTLPVDLVAIRSLRLTEDKWPLDAVPIQTIDYSASVNSKPQVYAVEGSDLILYPTPNGIYGLELRYLSNNVEMTDDAEYPPLPDEYADVLVAYAISRAQRSEDDYEAAAFYMQEFKTSLAELANDVQFRDRSLKQIPGMVMGSDMGPRFLRPAP